MTERPVVNLVDFQSLSIVGWFDDRSTGRQTSKFIGSFTLLNNFTIDGGAMHDRYGVSTFEAGYLDEKEGLLEFTKKYVQQGHSFNYNFRRNPQTGIWEGEFRLPTAGRYSQPPAGRAACIVERWDMSKIDLLDSILVKT